MTQKQIQLIAAVVVSAAIIHNGKHYNIGDEIEVTEKEFAELSVYLHPKDEAVQSELEAKKQAKAQALALAQQAEQERQALLAELEQSKTAHAQAEALATENGLRADKAEARVKELEATLKDKEAEIAKLSAKPTASKGKEKAEQA